MILFVTLLDFETVISRIKDKNYTKSQIKNKNNKKGDFKIKEERRLSKKPGIVEKV